MTPKGHLITVQETAGLLRCTRAAVYQRIADGDLPAYRLGSRAIRIDVCDVEALLTPIVPKAGRACEGPIDLDVLDPVLFGTDADDVQVEVDDPEAGEPR